MTPPSEAELLALAERALEHAGEEAQVTAWWERWLSAGARGATSLEQRAVEVACVRDGGVARVETDDLADDGLRRAAEGARRLAGRSRAGSYPGLPEPAPGRPHDGWDTRLATLDPAEVAAGLSPGTVWAGGAARTAIVSTRGVRVFEQRTHTRLKSRGVELAGVALDAPPDPGPLGERRPDDLSQPATVGPGEYPVVLGPAAVAAALEPLRHTPLGGGQRIAAPNVNLSDSPRFPSTLPRSYDAEGVPRAPFPLIQDGVSAGSPRTGRTTEVGGSVVLDHLVLVGGGAAGIAELAAPIDDGLYLPALNTVGWRTAVGHPVLIRGGELIDEDALSVRVALDVFALLGSTQALTSTQWTVPVGRSARTAGATVCPAARFGGGVRVL